jgi:2-C-methyl-D-erythritol 4-phosphate cytidylyltransferase
MEVDGLIQAAGQGERLGMGPKAFVMLGEKTLLEHSVEALLPFVSRVIIAVAPRDLARAQALISNEKVCWIEGGDSRSQTTRRLIYSSIAPWILLHDVVHPFAEHEMIKKLLEMAFENQIAAPGIPNTAFLYTSAGKPLHPPGDVIVGQKPVALSRSLALATYEKFDQLSEIKDPSLLQVLELAGVTTNFVLGDSTNIKITTIGDLVLAKALKKQKHDE